MKRARNAKSAKPAKAKPAKAKPAKAKPAKAKSAKAKSAKAKPAKAKSAMSRAVAPTTTATRYYDSDDDSIYHTCSNCSIGAAIPDKRKVNGQPPAAMWCSECESLKMAGTCS